MHGSGVRQKGWSRWLPLTLCAAVAALAVACGPYQVSSDRNRTPAMVPLPVLVIEEPDIGYSHDPAEEYWRVLRLIDALGGNDDLAVVAPWEADVPPGRPWPEGSSLTAAVFEATGMDPDRVLMLEVELEYDAIERVLVPGERDPSGVRYQRDADAVLHLRALDGRSRDEVAAVSVAFEDEWDAAAEIEGDLHPRFTEAMDLAAERLRRELASLYTAGPAASAPTLHSLYSARHLADYGVRGERLNAQWSELTDADRTGRQLVWHQRVTPGMSVDYALFFDNSPPGILVHDAGEAVRAEGVEVGDLIVEIDGDAALGEHVWTRAFVRPDARREVTVVLIRGGERVEVRIPTAG